MSSLALNPSENEEGLGRNWLPLHKRPPSVFFGGGGEDTKPRRSSLMPKKRKSLQDGSKGSLGHWQVPLAS